VETFQVAHLNVQNVNLVVVFLNASFDSKSQREQHEIQVALQGAATSAGLAGNVVPVWVDSFDRMKFLAPRQQLPYFESVSYDYLVSQVNRTLTCQ
jgi:hypothetical protein